MGHLLQSSAQSSVSYEVRNSAMDEDWTIMQNLKAFKEWEETAYVDLFKYDCLDGRKTKWIFISLNMKWDWRNRHQMRDFVLINTIICWYIVKIFYYVKDSAEDRSQLFQTYNILVQHLRNQAFINF